MPWELAALAVILAAAWLWRDSLRARDEDGRLRLRRTYVFEFSETGDNRRHGAIVMLGARLEDLRLEPYRMQ